MCGIVGAYIPGGRAVDDAILSSMREAMAHRGPDGAGLWRSADGCCALGHRRLSIIDLSEAANQPMTNADGSVVVCFNGEIYNHAEVRRELEALGAYAWKTDHSDTETLLHAYEEWGLDCFSRFHGMWGVAIFDARNPQRPVLHLVRDRIGIKPVYVSRTARGEWLFASEIRALLAHPDVHAEMDLTAFWHYLTFIVAPAPLTLFRGVFKLPAGTMVSIDHQGRAVARRYWDCRPDPADMLDFADVDQAAAALMGELKASIARRMVSDVPFGVLLSGGVDSSMNVALMSELMDRPVTTFSIGYEGHDDYNEFNYARMVAKRYRTEHHETLITRQEAQEFLPLLVRLQDEPIADNVCIPLYFLARLVRQSGTTVVQVGEGADENFLGYWWCEHYRDLHQRVYGPARRSMRVPWWKRLLGKGKAVLPGLSGEDALAQDLALAGQELFWGGAVCWRGEMRASLTPHPERFAQAVDCPIEGLLPDDHRSLDSHDVVAHHLTGLGGLADPDVLQKIPYMEHKLRLPEHLLMRVDKLTMAHAVEARVPFLDHAVVDFARRLPARFKLHDGTGKYLLKRAAEAYLPNEIVYRKKQGFGAPMEQWFKEGDFGRRCLAAVERSALFRDGLLDRDYFTGLLRHQLGPGGGYSFHLWTVLNAVLWHESWVDGKEDCF